MIAIIDYDAGNIKSVEKAIDLMGEDAVLTNDGDTILAADRVVLPGVGNFGDAMNNLKRYHLISIIEQVVSSGKPFLGICLGMQLLFRSSEESPGVSGLGLLDGEIIRFQEREGYKIPHMGWNSLHFQHFGKLFDSIPEQSYVYFVHSYYLKAADEQIVKATADYIANIHASVEQGNVFGCQFHPEKSGQVGLHILRNFVELKKEEV